MREAIHVITVLLSGLLAGNKLTTQIAFHLVLGRLSLGARSRRSKR